MSGHLYWVSGTLNDRGTFGSFWSSTPYSYASSRYLYFGSTYVGPKYGYNKPDGSTLRCVASLFVTFLPELSAASPVFLQNLHLYFTSINFRRFAPRSKFFCNFPSRALRSLPLSVMMSGNLYWVYGNPDNRGTYGNFWASRPYSYTDSRLLVFGSTNVYSKSGYYKLGGFPLRCVALSHSIF